MSDNVKRISSTEGITKLFDPKSEEVHKVCRQDVLRDDLPHHIIDTCVGFDTGFWETGVIVKDGNTIVVEQYDSREEAVIGHAKWLESLRENPSQELKEIHIWEI